VLLYTLLLAQLGVILMSEVIRVGITVRLVVKHLVIVLIERLKLEANHESVSERLRCELEEVWLYKLSCLRQGGVKFPWLATLAILVGSNMHLGSNHPETRTPLPEVELEIVCRNDLTFLYA